MAVKSEQTPQAANAAIFQQLMRASIVERAPPTVATAARVTLPQGAFFHGKTLPFQSPAMRKGAAPSTRSVAPLTTNRTPPEPDIPLRRMTRMEKLVGRSLRRSVTRAASGPLTTFAVSASTT